jgi:hypothetical protein
MRFIKSYAGEAKANIATSTELGTVASDALPTNLDFSPKILFTLDDDNSMGYFYVVATSGTTWKLMSSRSITQGATFKTFPTFWLKV